MSGTQRPAPSMHVQYVALCDQIVLGVDGKPSLIGVFNDVQAASVPFTLPRLAFAARILFTADEVGRDRRVEVVLKDPNGVEIGRPGGELNLPSIPPGLDSIAVDIPLVFDMFQVTDFGRYTFLLHVDGAPSAAVQLAVRQGANA
jgi:hypothetical protein